MFQTFQIFIPLTYIIINVTMYMYAIQLNLNTFDITCIMLRHKFYTNAIADNFILLMRKTCTLSTKCGFAKF